VLAIDDMAPVRELLALVLDDGGYDVVLAEDGRSGLQTARESAPDVILLDMSMPDMHGLEVLDELAGDPHLARIPVLVLSGETGPEGMVAAFERGAHDYITKPFDAEVLKARVTAARRAKDREDKLRQAAARLHGEAMSDALTGLANRRSGELHLQRLVALSARDGPALSVVKADVDRFKEINDHYGHAAGDQALREIARRLAGRARGSDIVVRWGGDEFVVLLPNTAAAGAEHAGVDLAGAVRDPPLQLGGGASLATTLSVGVAQWESGPAGALLDRADQAMYSAKAGGGDRVGLWCG
jgi:diguanylate cyclase (GGDEF)-like protein